jgi:hypothetical protein
MDLAMAKIHQYDENRAPDADFVPGELGLLCPGNSCRLLDPRRTPGVIEDYDPDCAMFRWRITAFEHNGRFWDVPAEDVARYQFDGGSKRLDEAGVKAIVEAVSRFQAPLVIAPRVENRERTETVIEEAESFAGAWLKSNSSFLREGGRPDLDSRTGPSSLARDCSDYMESLGMEEIERRSAENIVLNPDSGEWIKGMEIVLAEMGLAGYKGKIPRTHDIFEGPGAKENRSAWLIRRIAFVRAYFRLLGMDEVVLYRGMSVENPRSLPSGALTSYTFSLKVARSFCDFDRHGRSRESLLLKRTVPARRILMTYLETAAMNEDYREAEALVLSGL